MGTIIGRKNETAILHKAFNSKRSRLIAIYGRRRVGKTFLIREYYKNSIKFELTGISQGTYRDQLKNFTKLIRKASTRFNKQDNPKDWLEAFEILEHYIDGLKGKLKKVIFIDEFPWLATKRSRFIGAFENFWNTYATKRDDLVVVICGSAASYMIKNIINNKGGLYGRIDYRINLKPFNLHETKLFLENRKIKYSQYDLIQLYMMIGGVAYYLDKIERGDSISANIDRLCFEESGELIGEFEFMYKSLFDNSDMHLKIVRTLAKTRKGITRKDILEKTKLQSNQKVSTVIEELIESGFLSKYKAYKKKTFDSLFRLSDEYSYFYLSFIEKNMGQGKNTWKKLQQSRTFNIWSGFSFETLCLKHADQIKKGLNIEVVNSTNYSWFNDKAQIDLLIDRDDRIVNICEIKFYNAPFNIDANYVKKLRIKMDEFRRATRTKKSFSLTMITTFGVNPNKHSNEIVDKELTMECLFKE
ncbi:MAG TPA: ATP-binding protein [Lutibacter sp.]|nr:ATP-binding protein [Lutibacter sp.]